MTKIADDDFSKLEYEGWQRVAGKYPDCWAHLTQHFADPILDAAKVTAGMRVLDVACGPGIVSKKIEERNAISTGVDFSAEMISIAKNKFPNIEFKEGDAQDLEFADESFDAVVMNFGMLHLPQPLNGMKEALRVLRNKGWFAFTVWASVDKSPAPKVMNDAKQKFADMNVPMPAAVPYDFFESKENCRDFLSKAGFDAETVQYDTLLVHWLVPTAGYLFDAELNSGVRNAAFLRQQSKETLNKIKEYAEKNMEQFKVNDGYALPFVGCIIAAQKS